MREKLDQKIEFNSLTPEELISIIREMGFAPTGRVIPLNSYENRVFEVELEESEPIVVKVYRPGRWSKETIQDEHNFIDELLADGVPTVAPIKYDEVNSILDHGGLYSTAFPKIKGRIIDEFIPGDFKEIGALLARLHNVGARENASNRHELSGELGKDALYELEKWVRPEVSHRYFAAGETILSRLDDLLPEFPVFRIHGDCHRGNLMDDGERFFFVDFDDFCVGPAAQDFWMLLSSDEADKELEEILEGYESLRDLPRGFDDLFGPLRGLRVITYSAWIAKRWSDPTFPKLFPQFQDANYWATETESLEKIAWQL